MRYLAAILLLAAGFFSGCRRGMYDHAKQRPLAESEVFANGQSSRLPPPHAVPQEAPPLSPEFTAKEADGTLVTRLPVALDKQLLLRGRERYEIYCAVCHARTGAGNGIIVQRGFPPPPAFDSARLVAAPIGHFYDVITNGYGVMFSYAARVAPEDRWAIAAYIRVLQTARTATPADLLPEERAGLGLTSR